MNRFFISPENIQGNFINIPADTASQIRRVLRLREGEHVCFLDNFGNIFECEITYPDEQNIFAEIVEKRHSFGEPSCYLTLYIALTQREKFEWILQKCTEAGVCRFVPMVTERTLIRSGKDVSGKKERWNKILKEAAEQCGRGRIPELLDPVSFREAVLKADADLKLFFWENENQANLKTLIDPIRDTLRSAAMLIGPEGGFSADEAALAQDSGWSPCTLGKRIYRMETAAIAAPMLVLYEIEMRA